MPLVDGEQPACKSDWHSPPGLALRLIFIIMIASTIELVTIVFIDMITDCYTCYAYSIVSM